MWFADQHKQPMILALLGTIIGLTILSLLWWKWHAPTETQPVDSYKVNAQGDIAPAQRSQPAIGEGAAQQ